MGATRVSAVIEGLCEGSAAGRLPGRERVLVGALRMGSGNPLARQFGIPKDPEAALRGILENVGHGRTAPCCVMRCEIGTREGGRETRHAATMAGFGQFGRVPGDLERWHRRLSGPRAVAGRLFGVERLTGVGYVLALLARSASCALSGDTSAEVLEVSVQGRKEVLHLLAGVAMNFPVSEIPVDPATRAEVQALSLYLAPYAGRLSALELVLALRRVFRNAVKIRLGRTERVEIRLVDQEAAEFFLDEDPTTFHGQLTLQIAGSLAFVPGPEYGLQSESEVDA